MKIEKKRRVRVKLGRNSYDIFIGPLSGAANALDRVAAGRDVAVITDANVAKNDFVEPVCELCSGAAKLGVITLKPGEKVKTFEAVAGICSFAAANNFDRHALFAALSGGVGGDLCGFAAGIYKRGIDFIQIPTTLLAMVDSSVGGKTGCDLPEGKNLIGLFKQPKAVFIDPAFLRTLPAKERRNGLAEIIKYGVIRDRGLFDRLWDNRRKLLNFNDIDFYTELISDCCAIKADVVGQDEKESGIRAILNFGHTFGHALELLSGFKTAHGAAVARGMSLAAKLAVKTNLLDKAESDRIDALLDFVKLPIAAHSGTSPEAMLEAMRGDKKNQGQKITFVLPEKIGRVRIVNDIPESTVLEFLREQL